MNNKKIDDDFEDNDYYDIDELLNGTTVVVGNHFKPNNPDKKKVIPKKRTIAEKKVISELKKEKNRDKNKSKNKKKYKVSTKSSSIFKKILKMYKTRTAEIKEQNGKNKIFKEVQKNLNKTIKEEEKEQKRKEKIADTIHKNLQKKFAKEDKELKKIQKLPTKKNIDTLKLKKINGRYTEPKEHRNIISRIHNGFAYNRGDFEEIEEDRANGEMLKYHTYKQIQRYEDTVDDKSIRKGIIAFEATLAAAALISSAFLIKTTVNEIKDMVNNAQNSVVQENGRMSDKTLIRRAEGAMSSMGDQQLFYEYTDGHITEAEWLALPDEARDLIRNPILAAEAANKNGYSQQYLYQMTSGDLSTETWEKLPEEIKVLIPEPVSTAKEYFENGEDQVYLYSLSRGKITHEFWENLPEEIKQYVRDPLELAKEFAESGDDTGYLEALSKEGSVGRVSHESWIILPDELKRYVKDPQTLNLDDINNNNKDYDERD